VTGPYASAGEIADALRAGLVTRRQLVAQAIERYECVNPVVNAVVTLDAARCLARAEDLDRAAAPEPGPLDGLVCTVKDSFETAGLRTTAGARAYADHVPAASAPAVQRLLDAGGLLLGKSNLPKLAGDLQTDSALLGRACNPWDPTRTTGGSSGGGAAAVATGIAIFDLASDHAGSARIPAAYCGVYGYRPTAGLVPARGHIPPPPGTLAGRDLLTPGILARHPADIASVLSAVAGPERAAGRVWRLALPPWPEPPAAGYRVGLWQPDDLPLDGAVQAVVDRLVAALPAAGAAVSDCSAAIGSASVTRLFHSLLGATVGPMLDDERFALAADYSAGTEDDGSTYHRDAVAVAQSHRDWLIAQEDRARLAAAVDAVFEHVDVLVAPTTPTTAPHHDDAPDRHARTIVVNGAPCSYFDQLTWTSLAGVADLPAVVVPVGLAEDGLPVGLQVMAASHDDLTALRFAAWMLESGLALDATPPL
jgi:amidase